MHLSQYNTTVHVYQALVMSVLLYGAEIWTLLVADMKILVTSYVIDAYLCLAVLHAWTHMMLCV